MIDLAAGLRDAADVSARAQARLADFLYLSLPEWRPRFPPRLSWAFTEPATLDVFGVFGSRDNSAQPRMDQVARSLFARGFAIVKIHDHDGRRVITCNCQERTL